jgi:hypothetical protein
MIQTNYSLERNLLKTPYFESHLLHLETTFPCFPTEQLKHRLKSFNKMKCIPIPTIYVCSHFLPERKSWPKKIPFSKRLITENAKAKQQYEASKFRVIFYAVSQQLHLAQ